MEQEVRVYVEGHVRTPLFFELTRNKHTKATDSRVFTVTACFSSPPLHLHAQAWRILLEVCRGKELLPRHVKAYAARQVRRFSRCIPPDLRSVLQEGADAGAGSSSSSSSGSPSPKRNRCVSPPPGLSAASLARRAPVIPTITGAATSASQFIRPAASPVEAGPPLPAAAPPPPTRRPPPPPTRRPPPPPAQAAEAPAPRLAMTNND